MKGRSWFEAGLTKTDLKHYGEVFPESVRTAFGEHVEEEYENEERDGTRRREGKKDWMGKAG